MAGKEDIQGWMNPCSLEWLAKKASEMESVVEIGCWKGRTTHTLLINCKGIVYAVDHFRGSPSDPALRAEAKRKDISQEFIKNVGRFPNLRLLKMSSMEASAHFQPKSVDMVFVDGSHTYEDVKADLEAWIPIAKKLICGHDYYGYGGLKRAVDEKFGAENILYENEIWAVALKDTGRE